MILLKSLEYELLQRCQSKHLYFPNCGISECTAWFKCSIIISCLWQVYRSSINNNGKYNSLFFEIVGIVWISLSLPCPRSFAQSIQTLTTCASSIQHMMMDRYIIATLNSYWIKRESALVLPRCLLRYWAAAAVLDSSTDNMMTFFVYLRHFLYDDPSTRTQIIQLASAVYIVMIHNM